MHSCAGVLVTRSLGGRVGQERKIDVGGVNIRIHPHPPGRYEDLLRRIFRLKKSVRIRGDQHLVIKSMKSEEYGLSGELARFTRIDMEMPWLNLETLEEADDEEVEEISWPDGLFPNFVQFRYRLYTKEHLFVFETYIKGKSISPRSVWRFFEKLFADDTVTEGDVVTVDLVVDHNAVATVLALPTIRRLRLVFRRPNPDELDDDIFEDLKDRLLEENAEEVEIASKAPRGGELDVSNKTKQLARAAAQNGEVRAWGRLEDGTPVTRSTINLPLVETDTYDAEDSSEPTLSSLMSKFLSKVRANRQLV